MVGAALLYKNSASCTKNGFFIPIDEYLIICENLETH